MRGGAQPAHGGRTRTVDREELLAERAALKATPATPERSKALAKIAAKIKRLEFRSERNGI